jgi:imidazolonepropionase-like amidohydrolase
MRNLLIITFAAFLAGCMSESPSGTAITNVTIIDAVSGVRENQTVIFHGDEITSIQSADTEVNAAEVINGTSKFLIPGLWDFHVHLTYDDR